MAMLIQLAVKELFIVLNCFCQHKLSYIHNGFHHDIFMYVHDIVWSHSPSLPPCSLPTPTDHWPPPKQTPALVTFRCCGKTPWPRELTEQSVYLDFIVPGRVHHGGRGMGAVVGMAIGAGSWANTSQPQTESSTLEVGKSLWSPSSYLLRWHVSSEVPPPKSPHQHPQPGTKSSNRWVYRDICHSNHHNLFYFMCMFYDLTSFTKVVYRNIGALLMATLLKKVPFSPQQLLTAYICSGGVKSPETFPLLNWLKH